MSPETLDRAAEGRAENEKGRAVDASEVPADPTNENDGWSQLSAKTQLTGQIGFSADTLEPLGEHITDEHNRSKRERSIRCEPNHPVSMRRQSAGSGSTNGGRAWRGCRRPA